MERRCDLLHQQSLHAGIAALACCGSLTGAGLGCVRLALRCFSMLHTETLLSETVAICLTPDAVKLKGGSRTKEVVVSM